MHFTALIWALRTRGPTDKVTSTPGNAFPPALAFSLPPAGTVGSPFLQPPGAQARAPNWPPHLFPAPLQITCPSAAQDDLKKQIWSCHCPVHTLPDYNSSLSSQITTHLPRRWGRKLASSVHHPTGLALPLPSGPTDQLRSPRVPGPLEPQRPLWPPHSPALSTVLSPFRLHRNPHLSLLSPTPPLC